MVLWVFDQRENQRLVNGRRRGVLFLRELIEQFEHASDCYDPHLLVLVSRVFIVNVLDRRNIVLILVNIGTEIEPDFIEKTDGRHS